jgi:hypothetical protein
MLGNVTPITRGQNVGQQPTLFELQGYGTKISYSTTSVTGQPLLSYEDQHRDLQFSGSDIRLDETEIGMLVTVAIEVVPDSHRLMLSFPVPRFNLGQAKESVFRTEAVLTNEPMTNGEPPLNQGQSMTYSTLTLTGRARFAIF